MPSGVETKQNKVCVCVCGVCSQLYKTCAWGWLSVCPSVSVCLSTWNKERYQWLQCYTGNSKSTAFKSYGVKQERKSYAWALSSPWPVFAALHTVEASEVTQMSSCESQVAYQRIQPFSRSEKRSTVNVWFIGCGLYTCVYIGVACVYNYITCVLYTYAQNNIYAPRVCTLVLFICKLLHFHAMYKDQDTSLVRTHYKSGHLTNQDTSVVRTHY